MGLFVPGKKVIENLTAACGVTPDANYLWCRQVMKPNLYAMGLMLSILNRVKETSWGTRNVVLMVTADEIVAVPVKGWNIDQDQLVARAIHIPRGAEQRFNITEKIDTTQVVFASDGKLYAFVVSKHPGTNGEYVQENLKALKQHGFFGRFKAPAKH